jgi:hypothetical protein
VAELGEEGAREQRVDLVVLGDKDRQPPSLPAPLDAASLGSGAAGSKASSAEKRAASEVARTGLIR